MASSAALLDTADHDQPVTRCDIAFSFCIEQDALAASGANRKKLHHAVSKAISRRQATGHGKSFFKKMHDRDLEELTDAEIRDLIETLLNQAVRSKSGDSAAGSLLQNRETKDFLSLSSVQQMAVELFCMTIPEKVFKVQMFKFDNVITVCLCVTEEALREHADMSGYSVQLSRGIVRKIAAESAEHVKEKARERVIQAYEADTVPAFVPFEKEMLNPNNELRTRSCSNLDNLVDDDECILHLDHNRCDAERAEDMKDLPDIDMRSKALFSSRDRIRMITAILGMYFRLGIFTDLGVLQTWFPVHDESELINLRKKLVNNTCNCAHRIRAARSQVKNVHIENLTRLRSYFGERLAFYFAYTSHACKWLLWIALLGILLWWWENFAMTVAYPKQRSIGGRIALGVFTSMWTACWIQSWIQREACLAHVWGVDNSLKNLQQNWERHDASAYGESQNDYQQKWLHLLRVIMSWTVTMIYSTGGLIVTFFIMKLRGYLRWNDDVHEALKHNEILPDWFVTFLYSDDYIQMDPLTKTSVLLSLEQQIYFRTMPFISLWLTERERWYYEKDFRTSYALKIGIVNFIATFAGVVYDAFFREFVEGCEQPVDDAGRPVGPDACMHQVIVDVETLFTIFISCSLLDIIWPMVSGGLKSRGKHLNLVQKQALRDPYDGDAETNDYQQIVFPISFVSFFITAIPLAPVLAWICVKLQEYMDVVKLMKYMRRPYPSVATGIGNWRLEYHLLLLYVSVAVNIGIIIFRLNSANVEKLADDIFADMIPQDGPARRHFMVLCKILLLVVAMQLFGCLVAQVKWMFPGETSWLRQDKVKQIDQVQWLDTRKVEKASKQGIFKPGDVNSNNLKMLRLTLELDGLPETSPA